MNLNQEKERMNQFFEKLSDEELLSILRDLDWQHYAVTFNAPRLLTSQYSVVIKSLPNVPAKPWELRHRSVPNKAVTQDRLAA